MTCRSLPSAFLATCVGGRYRYSQFVGDTVAVFKSGSDWNPFAPSTRQAAFTTELLRNLWHSQ